MSYWLSFADMTRPHGQRFLGACVVDADDMLTAVRQAWALGCNPGGEALGHPLPATVEPFIDARWRRRLLTRDECNELELLVFAALTRARAN